MESIILALDEDGKKRTYATAINISDILTTENPEEAMAFPTYKSAQEGMHQCIAFFGNKYRAARGIENVDTIPGSITMSVLTYTRTFKSHLSIVMAPKE